MSYFMFQVFPLKTETIYLNTAANAKPLATSLKSDLRLEMEATEAKLRELKKEAAGDDTNEADLALQEKAMLQQKLTRDELLAQRREMAYLRMRESQQSAKLRMKNKIKSKKYHKLLKRQKMLEEIKAFELLQKTDPEAAMEKLNALEKNRVLERASLRHKNTGVWAKNLQVRAKYDKDVRKDLAEQLQISRELTNKKHVEESEEEQEEDVAAESRQSNGRHAELHSDPFNPWTKVGSAGKPTGNAEEQKESWRKYWLERNKNDALLQAYFNNGEQNCSEEDEVDTQIDDEKDTVPAEPAAAIESMPLKVTAAKKSKLEKVAKRKAEKVCAKTSKKGKKVQVANGWLVEELQTNENPKLPQSIDDIFDAQEDIMQSKLQETLQKLKAKAKSLKTKTGKQKSKTEKDALKNLNDLSFKQTTQRVEIDEELNADEEQPTEEEKLLKTASSLLTKEDVRGKSSEEQLVIDPKQVAEVKFKQTHLGTALEASHEDFDMDNDYEDKESQLLKARQLTISQAFEDDDIIADFSKEKTQDAELKNTQIELSMPGWGSWAGAGISAEAQAKRKANANKRLLLKFNQKPEQRRDDNKQNVYINEDVNKQLRTHLVSDVPFPFTSLADYEASIRAPIGRAFVPETAFKMLTRPAVITHKGQIIEPMDESELLKGYRRPRHVVDKRIERAAAEEAPIKSK